MEPTFSESKKIPAHKLAQDSLNEIAAEVTSLAGDGQLYEDSTYLDTYIDDVEFPSPVSPAYVDALRNDAKNSAKPYIAYISDPYPRRRELPTQERAITASFDMAKAQSHLALNALSQKAALWGVGDKLYEESSYLGDYIDQVDPLFYTSAAHVNEIRSVAKEQTLAYVESIEERERFVDSLPELTKSLLQPVRDFSDARHVKMNGHFDANQPERKGYASIPIDPSSEPLVSIFDYNIPGQSYYSRRNGVTGDPVPGVKPDVYVRQSIAEKLAQLNELLHLPEITEFFGGEVELFVDEGYRDPNIQIMLHDELIPRTIMNQLAEKQGVDLATADEQTIARLTEEMIPMRNKKIGKTSPRGQGNPGPHQTGSAVDVKIRYKQSTSALVPRVDMWFGKKPTSLIAVNDPDHFEHTIPTNREEIVAQQNLRAWHALLTAVGLTQNPTEFWHAGAGDQLSLTLDGDLSGSAAEFGWPVDDPETYVPPESLES